MLGDISLLSLSPSAKIKSGERRDTHSNHVAAREKGRGEGKGKLSRFFHQSDFAFLQSTRTPSLLPLSSSPIEIVANRLRGGYLMLKSGLDPLFQLRLKRGRGLELLLELLSVGIDHLLGKNQADWPSDACGFHSWPGNPGF